MLAFLFLFFNIAQAIVVSGPSGPWSVSHKVVELTDEFRWDPYAPEDSRHKRRILTSLFIPTQKDQKKCQSEKSDYMPPRTRGGAAKTLGLPNTTFEGLELEFCEASTKKRAPLPIVIFSPGFSSIRLLSSAQAQSLASQGNVVITVDHPYDGTIVEFPDGTVVYGANPNDINDKVAEKGVKVRSEDISFLIDQILEPSSLGGILDGFDTSKIFVYGHSLGGATSAQVALNDDRVLGGLDLDGKLYGSVSEAGLDTPLFVVGADSTEEAASYFKGIMGKVDAAKMFLTINGTGHMSFVDLPLVLSLLDFTAPGLERAIGTIDGKRIASITDDILGAVTSLLFKGKTRALCQLEDKVEEAVMVERDLKKACR
ncbi:hypothetical protein NW759_012123 [Fusarium solani]|nr:hypothetical protein NW759_012123 [Fusarium solani]